MPRLTKEFIAGEAVAPAAGQIIYRDDELRGFALRVTPRGKSYIVEKRVNGVNRRITLGKCAVIPVELARKEALKVLADMTRGIDPKTGRKSSPCAVTLQEVLDKYLAVRKLRTLTVSTYRRLIERNLHDWLELAVTSITKDMIQLRHKQLSSGTSKGTSGYATANSTMKALQALLNFACEHFSSDDEPLIKVNPVSRLTRDREWHRIPARRGLVPDNKLADWYRGLRTIDNKTVQDYFLTLLLTGFRRTEAATLLWQDIDFSARIITLPASRTKTNHIHIMPMSDFLVDLVRARYVMHRTSKFVFPGRSHNGALTDFRRGLLQIRETCGVEFTAHDLRRTFITMAEKLDIPHNVLKRLANHNSNLDVTTNYVVIDIERLRQYANQICNEFVRLLGADIDELVRWRRTQIISSDYEQLRLDLSWTEVNNRL